MNFFKYLLANRLWLFVGFVVVVAVFVYASTFFGAGSDDVRGAAIAVGVLTAVFVGANFIAWKRSR